MNLMLNKFFLSIRKDWIESVPSALSIALLVFFLPTPANSHPVVFQGGTAIMGHHLGEMSEIEVVHSPTWWSGFGLFAERASQSTQVLAKATALLWRGNFPDLQSNFYLGTGIGHIWGDPMHADSSTQKNDSRRAVYVISTEFDAEDRQYYGRFRYNLRSEDGNLSSNQLLTRIGLAPYKANTDEPALWGLVEWTASNHSQTHHYVHEVTPLIRFFYRNALFEIGSSFSGKVMFNYMFHYF